MRVFSNSPINICLFVFCREENQAAQYQDDTRREGNESLPAGQERDQEMKQSEIAAPAPMMRMLLLLSVPASSAVAPLRSFCRRHRTQTREPESL